MTSSCYETNVLVLVLETLVLVLVLVLEGWLLVLVLCTWSLSTWYSSTSYSCPWSCLHQIWNFLSFAILSKSKAWDRQTDRQTVWSTWSGLFLLHILYLYHRIQFKIHWTFTLYDDVLCMRYFWYHSFIYLITWLELNIECTYLPVLWLDLF